MPGPSFKVTRYGNRRPAASEAGGMMPSAVGGRPRSQAAWLEREAADRRSMRPAILFVSAFGTLLFGTCLLLSLLNPLLVEQGAREVVRIEVERRAGARIDTLSDSRIVGLAQKALQKADLDLQRSQEALRQELPRKVANVVAEMLRADCECRRRLVERMQRNEESRLGSIVQVRENFQSLIEAAYASVTSNLMREFRIFCGSNAAAFALLGAVTLARRRAALQLLLPAFVLLGAVATTGSLYLFEQNWLHTVVFGEYVGYAYSLYLAAVALLLADVAFNRARVTTRVVNLVLNALGAAASAVPC